MRQDKFSHTNQTLCRSLLILWTRRFGDTWPRGQTDRRQGAAVDVFGFSADSDPPIIALMAKYPIFLDLEERRAVVVGGGQVAYQKTQGLLEAGARVVVVTRHIIQELASLCQARGSEVVLSDYAREYLGRARVVIACTDDRSVNETVYRDCQEAGILCNVVDTPDLCDFYVPAVVRRNPLQIAIGTDGSSPAFAKKVRKHLEGQFTEEHSAFLKTLGSLRPEVLSAIVDLGQREALLSEFADDESFGYFAAHGAAAWQARCRERIPTD